MSNLDNWSDIIPSAVKLPLSVYKNRKDLQYWWKRLMVYIDKGDTNIVVTGRPSVGKSVLTSVLYGEAAELSWELPETSTSIESRAIRIGEWTSIMRVIPGQKMRARSEGLDEAFSTHKNLDGVIYVVNWGYTSVRSKVARQSLIQRQGIDTIEKLRKFNMQDELIDFRDTCAKIIDSHALGRGPKWLLIVANKADLFWDKVDEAQQYYHPKAQSPFVDILNECISEVGRQNMKVDAVPVCAWPSNLEWHKDVIQNNIGGIDNQRQLLSNMFDTMANLSK